MSSLGTHAAETAARRSVSVLDGLDHAEAARRLAAEGPNELAAPARDRLVARALRQLREPMALLLVGAATMSGLVLGERVDAVAILAIVVLNAAIGVFQEGKAARALEALRAMGSPVARVRRSGTLVTVPAREVVPGDVILLAGGDRIPADARLLEASSLEVDESTLTGESLPVGKDATTKIDPTAGLADRPWFVYSGTFATRGSATGVVEATGARTALGSIAAHLREPATATPLQRELAALTGRLGILAVVIAAGVLGLTLLRLGLDAESIEQAFLAAVALTVAAVPEGLATVVVVGLALGVRRMADHGAIVRRLPAVETLGSTTVILTDKTGTLTENRLHVSTIVSADLEGTPAGLPRPVLERVENAAIGCNDAETDPPSGDPLDIALLELADATRAKEIRAQLPRVDAIPFHADRRRMTTLHQDGAGLLLLVKGAPETLLELVSATLDAEGRSIPLDEARREQALARADALAKRGARVIALAQRQLPGRPDDLTEEEHDMTLVALVGLSDRVREEAAGAVAEAQEAGISVVMVTGDHPGTGLAIAEQVGVIDERARALTGADVRMHGLPQDPLSVRVYARVDPDEKLALVEALQDQGHVLAVTGDGVNDAPALRRADIGVAMGRGSDVARQASDMVITDDNLTTVVEAIREGRGIYDNLRKVVDYLIAGNISEIMVVVSALALFPSLGVPLLPLQLLWINLLTDGLPALALGVDAFDPSSMRRPPRLRQARLLTARRIGFLFSRAVPISAVSIGALAIERYAWGASWTHARTVMFTVLVVAHLLLAFQARWPHWRDHRPREARDGPLIAGGLRASRWLLGAVGMGVVLQAVILGWEPARALFDLTMLGMRDALLVLVASIAPAASMIGVRALSRRRP
ncbi:MAG TPA: cation-translocating P-type ATPase [Actinomycetota bacterium]